MSEAVNGIHMHDCDKISGELFLPAGFIHCPFCGEEPSRETGLRDLITDLPDESGYDYWAARDGWVSGWEGED